jgi:glycosyltransferase involved in cell wall biosynthesis
MNVADIYVLPSNGYEGWGTVVNEAMAEACAVIASIESGAAKSIISDMENGILYNSRDWRSLSEKINLLVEDENLRLKIQSKGQKLINELWSPEVGADRFVKVCDALIGNKPIPDFKKGPLKNLDAIKYITTL